MWTPLIGICNDNGKVVVCPKYSWFEIENYESSDDHNIEECIYAIYAGQKTDPRDEFSMLFKGLMYLIDPTDEIIEIYPCKYEDICSSFGVHLLYKNSKVQLNPDDSDKMNDFWLKSYDQIKPIAYDRYLIHDGNKIRFVDHYGNDMISEDILIPEIPSKNIQFFVVQKDGKFNFMDHTGAIKLNEWVVDVNILNDIMNRGLS